MQKVETVKKVLKSLEEKTGAPYRYDHFRQSEAVPPPFVVWRKIATGGQPADGGTYYYDPGIDIELYADTEEDMEELMAQLRELLDGDGVFYKITADTVYIEDQDFYESLFEL